MDVKSPLVVVLGTGGTIAGTASGSDELSYRAAQLSVDQLLRAVPALSGVALETRQVAQVDSKDMDWSIWQALATQVQAALARDDVGAVVITHGTDTLEETAYLLHRLVDSPKPVVLTAAMRPATSGQADGPGNLRDAVRVAARAAVRRQGGVAVVMAGVIWPGHAVRKAHSWHVDAFDAGGTEPLGRILESGDIIDERPWVPPGGAGWACMATPRPPRVDIVTSHAGADGGLVEALLSQETELGQEVRGLVVACTGHGSIHQGLTRALEKAEGRGIRIWRSSRVARGGVQAREGDRWPAAGNLTAAQARVALMLDLLGVPPAHLAG